MWDGGASYENGCNKGLSYSQNKGLWKGISLVREDFCKDSKFLRWRHWIGSDGQLWRQRCCGEIPLVRASHLLFASQLGDFSGGLIMEAPTISRLPVNWEASVVD